MAGDEVAVVIGASRGIGLSLAEALKNKGYKVIAAVRRTTEELQVLGVEVCEGVDVGTGVGNIALESRELNLLVIAAGVQEVDKLETVSKQSIQRQFEINAIGPLFAVKELQPKLVKGSKVVLISSKNASITEVEATGGELYGYRMSKVALNMAGRTLAGDLKKDKISVALIHPGVVNTQMLRSLRQTRGVPAEKLTANTITPDESAARILTIIEQLDLENSGSFWAADTGKIIGW